MNGRPIKFVTVFLTALSLCILCSPVQAAQFTNTGLGMTIVWSLDGFGITDANPVFAGCAEHPTVPEVDCSYHLYDVPINQVMNYHVDISPSNSYPTVPSDQHVIDVRYWAGDSQQTKDFNGLSADGQFYFWAPNPNYGATPPQFYITHSGYGSTPAEPIFAITVYVHFTGSPTDTYFPFLGGQRDNINTTFLHNSAKPGPPSLAQRSTRGSGPGVNNKFGLPRYWVNSATLNMVIEDSDFSYQGLGPDVAMTRTYNSNPLDGGMFGNGWRFAYDSAVIQVPLSDGRVHLIEGSGETELLQATGLLVSIQ